MTPSQKQGLLKTWSLALAALVLGVAGVLAPAASHAAISTFDHFTTGFELVGLHKDVPCESCHVGGIFKGTPKDCFSCHANGSRIGASSKPTNHILSGNDCAQCHTPFGWRPVAKFNHINVLVTCSSCHNGVQTVGKTANHVPTAAECSTCHLVFQPWKKATFNHTGITDGCAVCHDNIHAPGRPQTHVPTTNGCETCHAHTVPADFVTWAGTPMNHAGIVDTCQACHETGMNWYGVTMVDRPTPAADSFHPTATAANGADCKNCHTGFNVGDFNKAKKPGNHIPTATNAPCAACHDLTNLATMASLGAIHANAPSTTTNCQVCHGTNAASFAIPAINFAIVGIPSNHAPTSVSCEVCHAGAGSSFPLVPAQTGAKFTNSLMNHAGATTCAECHGPTVTTFAGINQIIIMPPTTPMGIGAHMPSSVSCETCHSAATPKGLIAANATASVPGSAFGTTFPNTTEIHAGMKTGCSACHEAGNVWMGVDKYPIAPKVFIITTQYTGFQARPVAAPTTNYQILDAAHPTAGDCVACHGTNFNYFDSQVKPDNHIPTAASATCSNCHNVGDFAQLPTVTNIHAYAPSQSTNCVQCHGTTQAATFAIPAAKFTITTMAQIVGGAAVTHITTSQSCETCHVGAGSSVSGAVVTGSTFAKSLMSHSGVTTCVECHGPTVKATSFTGIASIIIMPPTTPAGAASAHIPSSTACEACHASTVPAGLIAASAPKAAPGSLFLTPAPDTAHIHAGITSNCQSCHEGGYAWMSMGQYPISPTTFVSGSQYTGFQARPGATASTFVVKDAAHPKTGDCLSCHGTNINYFDSVVKPSNHIPTLSTATCANCHTGADFSVMPSLSNIHTYAPTSTTNCVLCHGTSQAATFAIPAANFTITTMAQIAGGGAVTHIPTTTACETCHVGAGSSVATTVQDTSKFALSKMNHAGITTCVSCHGPAVSAGGFTGIASIIIMPPTTPAGAASAHIPSVTTCESCHLSTMPAGLIAASAPKAAPGSLFLSPAPDTTKIHAGITSNCQSCHEGGYAWMSMGQYPISPSTFISGSQYTGFQARPGATASTFVVKDAAHPTTGDCVTCHGTGTAYFASAVKPSNHIPTLSTATCANCHTGTDFSVLPSLSNIHTYAPSSTTNCVLCHGTSQAATFAIPAANFTITTMAQIVGGGAVTHIPTTTSCETCHVGAGSSVASTVQDTSKFALSKMSHAGITTCVSCHGPTVSATGYTGIAKIIVMPAISPMGVASHVPSGTTCETCHLNAMPAGLIAASSTAAVPGSLFGTTVPSTTQIHTGVTTGCQACHESGYNWMGMTKYPIAPTTLSANTATQYTGFQTRPSAAAGTFMVLDAKHPATGDCYTCHGASFNYFTGQAEPAGHIPTLTGATCVTCHTTGDNTKYDTTPAGLTKLHTAVSTACSTCHATGKGPFTGVAGFTIVQTSTRGVHIPITNAGVPVECSGCHKSVSAFTGTIMSHIAIGDSGSSAAGNACDACHESTMKAAFFGVSIKFTRKSTSHYICGAPGTPTAPNTTTCSGGGSDCLNGCHQHNSIPSTYKKAIKPTVAKPAPTTPARVGGAAARGLTALDRVLRPIHRAAGSGPVDHSTVLGQSCVSCHDGVQASGVGPTHPKTTTACAACHSTMAWTPVMHVDHADVLGTCISCHNGKAAIGKPAGHVNSGNDCDRCHTTSAWKPAAFDHAGVIAGTCATCHNGLQAVTKSGRHVVTTLSCDTCHYVLGWTPVKPVAPPAVRRIMPLPRPPVVPRGRQSTVMAPPHM